MALTIEIINQQQKIPLTPARIKRIARKILKKQGVRAARLSLVFVTDRKIHALNKKFLRHDYPTDVLAFDLSEKNLSSCKNSKRKIVWVEGEIIVSTGAAVRQARQFHSTPHREILLYVAHGILHLLGYDDHAAAAREKMRKKEQEILDSLIGEKYDC